MMDHLRMFTFGSLFTGIGGIDLGFELAGIKSAWQVEIDKHCNTVSVHHWPDVIRYEDVKNVGRQNLEPVDIICGGFPCQDLSVAGRRDGLAGERSGLWWEFHRIIEELRPQWVVIENVPGLLSSNGGRDMGAILWALGKLRYGWAYASLDAQYFGLAQRRKRVFIVGCLGDWTSAAEVLFERESSAWDSAPSREEGKGTTRAVAPSLAASGRGVSRTGESRGQDPLVFQPRYYTRDNKTGGAPSETADITNAHKAGDSAPHIVAPTLTAPNPNAPRRDGKRQDGSRTDKIPIVFEPRYARNGRGAPREIVPPLKAQSGKGDSAPVVAFTGMAQSGAGWAPPSCPTSEDVALPLDTKRAQAVVYGFSQESDGHTARNAKDLARPITGRHGDPGVAAIYPTLRGQPNQGPGRMEDDSAMAGLVRRLMPIECERLQGFPDGHTAIDGMSDSARYRMLGNAVAVPVAQWIGHNIMRVANDD